MGAAFTFLKSNPWHAPCGEERREIIFALPGGSFGWGGGAQLSPQCKWGGCKSWSCWFGGGIPPTPCLPCCCRMRGGHVIPLGGGGGVAWGCHGEREGAVGGANYNSQKALREGPAPAANQRPRCRPIKGHRGFVSAFFYDGGCGSVCGSRRGDNLPPSALPRSSPAARPRHIEAPRAPRLGSGTSGRSDGLRRAARPREGLAPSLPDRARGAEKMPGPPWVSGLRCGLN